MLTIADPFEDVLHIIERLSTEHTGRKPFTTATVIISLASLSVGLPCASWESFRFLDRAAGQAIARVQIVW